MGLELVVRDQPTVASFLIAITPRNDQPTWATVSFDDGFMMGVWHDWVKELASPMNVPQGETLREVMRRTMDALGRATDIPYRVRQILRNRAREAVRHQNIPRRDWPAEQELSETDDPQERMQPHHQAQWEETAGQLLSIIPASPQRPWQRHEDDQDIDILPNPEVRPHHPLIGRQKNPQRSGRVPSMPRGSLWAPRP